MKDRMRCHDCSWAGPYASLLRAPHPFIENEEVQGCPGCRNISNFVLCCEGDDCIADATMGTPTPNGYRLTCYKHRPMKPA